MIYIKELITTETDYSEKSNDNISIYRSARIINTYLEKATIGDYAYCKDSTLGANVMLNRNSFVLNCTIDDRTKVGFNTRVFFSEIGKYCSISWDCSIGGPNHNMEAITTYELGDGKHLYRDEGLTIGNDVWICSGATILRGVTIGDGAVIAAGAVVNKDVRPYEIVGGIPSKHIGWRFDEEIVEKLLKLKWWELPADKIKENSELFSKKLTPEIIEKIKNIKEYKL